MGINSRVLFLKKKGEWIQEVHWLPLLWGRLKTLWDWGELSHLCLLSSPSIRCLDIGLWLTWPLLCVVCRARGHAPSVTGRWQRTRAEPSTAVFSQEAKSAISNLLLPPVLLVMMGYRFLK